jgi:hypothetical protein
MQAFRYARIKTEVQPVPPQLRFTIDMTVRPVS